MKVGYQQSKSHLKLFHLTVGLQGKKGKEQNLFKKNKRQA